MRNTIIILSNHIPENQEIHTLLTLLQHSDIYLYLFLLEACAHLSMGAAVSQIYKLLYSLGNESPTLPANLHISNSLLSSTSPDLATT